ncbi:MAG: hypothetical protein HXY23_04260 [Parvularculaceae bacterium]|nr:hypothetical protein [Parvularculaceae bacterium]
MRLRLETGVICALLVFLAFGSAAAQAPGYRDVDLGARRSGEIFTLKLGAQNANCGQPIDFRFNSKSNWLRLPADPVVRQVPAGQTKYLDATIDLSGAAPGPKIGFIDID